MAYFFTRTVIFLVLVAHFFVYIESAIFFLNRKTLTPKMMICDFSKGSQKCVEEFLVSDDLRNRC